MGFGILVCGLNGSGKSTLGRKLAESLEFYFIDNEELYFPKTDPQYIFANPRTRQEAEKLLMDEIKIHKNFVFAAVKGDYGENFYPFVNYVVQIQVPKDIRMQRVKDRSFLKFGDRMLEGGDLYRKEKSFFDLISTRTEDFVETSLQYLECPVLRIDGTKPVDENISYIKEQMLPLMFSPFELFGSKI